MLLGCSTVGDIKDSTVETVDKIVPVDLKGKDQTVFGGKDYATALVSRVEPKWFKVPERFQLINNRGELSPHLFYDVRPELNSKTNRVNFVVTTPEDSDRLYGIDISSGRHYTDKLLCEQADILGRLKTSIYQPPFTMGLIPRTLDQLGMPQKIIVFGDKEYFQANYKDHFFDGRIVGGYVEKYCRTGSCSKFADLTSRVVVIAVQTKNEKFENVKRIEDLRLLVDWKKVRAFIENGQGKNKIAGTFYPAYRMGPELTAIQTITSLKKQSIRLSNRKLNQMRSSCDKLYDYVWNKVGQPSKVERRLKKARSFKERKSILKSTNRQKDRFFFERFVSAYKRFAPEYNVCAKFVYPSNIHASPKRHWFMAYYSAVHLLNDLGYTFDCSRSLWVKNTVLASGRRSVPLKSEFKNCSARQIDSAFESAIRYLENLRLKNYISYRYIDYDRKSVGTHNKLYSWVFQENKRLQCFGEQRDLVLKQENFPDDIKWERWAPLLRVSQGKK
jgi:hypothetical protein